MGPAHAADPQTPAGVIPSVDQLRRAVPTLKQGDTAALPAQPLPRELGKPLDDITLTVRRYVVDDSAPAPLKEAIERLTAPYTGPDRSYEDLMNAVGAVIRFLQRDLKLYLGYAYLPEQQPVDGVVKIAVLEGRLDQVILNWRDDIPVDKAVVEAHLERLRPGSILRVADVERVVFLLNDLRGVSARFEVRQGRTPGTASLVVTPIPEARTSGKFEVDSFGSRFSGAYRAGATVTVASPLGRGDGVVLSGQSSYTGGLQFALAGYTLPVGNDGLKVGASVSKVRYKLSEEVPLSLNGDATVYSVYALYPMIRSRNFNLFAQASFEKREFIDRKGELGSAADAVKRSTEWRAGIAGDFRDNVLLGGVSSYDLALITSQMDYVTNGPVQALKDPSQRVRMNLGFSRLNNLVDNRLLGFFSFNAQRAWSNLDTTEQFSIGGANRVRAYAPGEGTGDEGAVATFELRWLPPEILLGRYARESVFSVFYDRAHVRFKRDASQQPPGFDNSASYSGYGIGYTLERPRQFAARLSLAWPQQGEARSDTVRRSPRAYATLSKPF